MLQQIGRQSTQQQQARYMTGNPNAFTQHQGGSSPFPSKGATDFSSNGGYRAYQQTKRGAPATSAAPYQMSDPLSALGGVHGDVPSFHPSKYEVLHQTPVPATSQGGGDQGVYSTYCGPSGAERSVYPHRHNYVRHQEPQQTNPSPKLPPYVPQVDQATRYDPHKGRDMTNIAGLQSQVSFDEPWQHHPQATHDAQRRAPPAATSASNIVTSTRCASDFAPNSYGIPTHDTSNVMDHNNPAVSLGGPSGATSVWTMNASQLPTALRGSSDFASTNEVKKAFSVAGEFIWHYFHLMQTQPQMLHCFYCRDSQVAHGSSLWAHQNWHRAMGEADIGALFEEILCAKLTQQSNPGESLIVRSNVKTLEAQPTRDDGIVMQATGYIETRDMGDRPFAHTVVMKRAQDTGSYVVLHDIFVFLDDLLMNQPMSTRSYGASQVSSAKSGSPIIPDDTTTIRGQHTGLDRMNIAGSNAPEDFSPDKAGSASEQGIGPDSVEGTSPPAPPTPIGGTNLGSPEAPAEVPELVIREAAVPPGRTNILPLTGGGTQEVPQPEESGVLEAADEYVAVPYHEPTISKTIDRSDANESPAVEPAAVAPSSTQQQSQESAKVFAWKNITKQAPSKDSNQIDTAENLPHAPAAKADKVPEVEPTSQSTTIREDFICKDSITPAPEIRITDSKSYAGRLLTGVRAVPKRLGMVVKRSGSGGLGAPGDGHSTVDVAPVAPIRTVWVSQIEGVSNAQIENAVAARLRGCPVEGRVVRIERMRNGPAGVIELDSPECVPMLLEKGLCIYGREVRVDPYKQSPSQINRETNAHRQGPRRDVDESERRDPNGDWNTRQSGQDDMQGQNGASRRLRGGGRGGGRGGAGRSGNSNRNPAGVVGTASRGPNVRVARAADNSQSGAAPPTTSAPTNAAPGDRAEGQGRKRGAANNK